MSSKLLIFSFVLLIILIIYYINYKDYSYNFYNEYNHLSLKNIIKVHNEIEKNKIILNKKIIPNDTIFFLSFDYQSMPIYYSKMLEVLTNYCNYHNNKLYIFDHFNDQKKISPYWNRVADFIKLSNIYKESPNTIIVYLDLDTIINSKYFNISISNITNSIDKIENKISNIYIGNDPSNSVFANAGIIIIRNTKWSKKFLNLWWSRYDPNIWNFVNNKWICKNNNIICPWARNGYEQGEFNNIYRNNELDSRNHITILHYSVISNPTSLTDGFIYHFHGGNENIKNIFINEIYNNYKQLS